MPDKPTSFYVPSLYEETEQQLKWNPVTGASIYTVEASVDGEFSSQVTTVYTGAGIDVPGIDAGEIWRELDVKELTWAQIAADDKTWDEFELLSTTGKSWDSIDSRYLDWADMEQMTMTWDAIEAMSADDDTYKGCDVTVPFNNQSMRFRVTASDGTTTSAPFPTTRQQIIALDENIIDISPANPVLVQIDGRLVRQFSGADFCLKYDEERLTFRDVFIQSKNPFVLSEALPYIHRNSDGVIKFICQQEIDNNDVWDGLVIAIEFEAMIQGQVSLTLERVNDTEQRII